MPMGLKLTTVAWSNVSMTVVMFNTVGVDQEVSFKKVWVPWPNCPTTSSLTGLF